MDKTIEHTSRLAKLDFTGDESKSIAKDFQNMLDFVDKIDQMGYCKLDLDITKAARIKNLRSDRINDNKDSLKLNHKSHNDYFVTYCNLNISELSKDERH
ncbi:MAG: aspartyl/glutamyl-tRNA amidotransferase subunit C [Candidatus Zixiibacteriota bacterium]